MTIKEKTEFTRIGLAFVGIATDTISAELVWRVVELVNRKKGKTSIRDTSIIKAEIEKKYKIKVGPPRISSSKTK